MFDIYIKKIKNKIIIIIKFYRHVRFTFENAVKLRTVEEK